MCLITFAWRTDPEKPLVVVANRDEFYARPTAPAGFWSDHPGIFAGRDGLSGGTWFGVNTAGRFAAVTNYRDPRSNDPQARSRGELVSDFLADERAIQDYASSVFERGREYNGFNLLLGDGRTMIYVSNRSEGPQVLDSGIYALSNALLDTPWPKTVAARNALRQWLARPDADIALDELLLDTSPADEGELPSTGVSLELERALSAQFIEIEGYGTRCVTTLMVDRHGRATFRERGFQPEESDRSHRFESFWT